MPFMYLVSSALADCVALGLYYPFELLKARIQIKTANYTGAVEGFASLMKSGELKTIYRGSPPYVANYISNYAIQFMVFESSHDFCKKKWGEKVDSYLLIPKGFMAGLIGSGLTNCFDVLTIKK